MGIKNFNKLVTAFCPTGHQQFHLSRLNNKKCGIDAFCWLYDILLRMKSNNRTFRANFFEKLNPILIQKPQLVYFVFDGKPPKEKAECLRKRRYEREKNFKRYGSSIRIQKEDLINYKNVIKSFENLAIIQCVDEAEAALVRLQKEKHIEHIFSTDTDIIALGGTYIFRRQNQWFEANYTNIKNSLGLTESQLLDLCVLLGTDFNPSVYRVGPKTSYNLIKIYGSLENIFSSRNLDGLTPEIMTKMRRTKILFGELGDYVSTSKYTFKDDDISYRLKIIKRDKKKQQILPFKIIK